MEIIEFAKKLNMKVVAGEESLTNGINGIYVCDLLSWVMSKGKKGEAWITILTNINIVAVATLVEFACIIIPEDVEVEEVTIKKANQNNVVILSSSMTAYEICFKGEEILRNSKLK